MLPDGEVSVTLPEHWTDRLGANDGVSVLKSSALVGKMVGTTEGAVLGTRVGTAVGAMVQLEETVDTNDHCETFHTYHLVVCSGHRKDPSSAAYRCKDKTVSKSGPICQSMYAAQKYRYLFSLQTA